MPKDIMTTIGVVVLIMLVIRRIAWWYWGIDRAIRALENIDASLRALPAVRRMDHQQQRRPARAA